MPKFEPYWELVYLRKISGISQSRLGELLGVSRFTISQWECGSRKPSETIQRFVIALTYLNSQSRDVLYNLMDPRMKNFWKNSENQKMIRTYTMATSARAIESQADPIPIAKPIW